MSRYCIVTLKSEVSFSIFKNLNGTINNDSHSFNFTTEITECKSMVDVLSRKQVGVFRTL